MSNIYIQEPPSNGKVLMKTTCGDIDIELWSKEAPKACRNFVQLCMEGYYDGVIFHRIIRGFIVQGGDPTGTGEGGESIYGAPFKDEFHSRLKFVRRGLVAMANAGPNDNGSQFFFTLDKCEHLNNKHTIFGKVTGQTIFNLLKFADVETDGDDRPVFPPKVKSTEVLSNPFDDIVPRETKKKDDETNKKEKKSKSKATKNFSLLSFGEEAEEDETETITVSQGLKHKSKSAHDIANDPKLVSETEKSEIPPQPELRGIKPDVTLDEEGVFDSEMAKRVREKLKQKEANTSKETSKKHKDKPKKEPPDPEDEHKKRKQTEEEGTKKKLKKEGNELDISDFMAERKKFKDQKRKKSKGGSREEQTLALLAKFQSKLQRLTGQDEDDEEEPEVPQEGQEEDASLEGNKWMAHKLQFDTHNAKVKDANIKDADTYDIFDPRNPMNKRKRDTSKKISKDKR